MSTAADEPADEPEPDEPADDACTRKGCGRPLAEHDYGAFCP